MSRQMEEKIAELKVVPVVVLEDAKDAAPLAKALCEGGLPCAEVTFRTAAAIFPASVFSTSPKDGLGSTASIR